MESRIQGKSPQQVAEDYEKSNKEWYHVRIHKEDFDTLLAQPNVKWYALCRCHSVNRDKNIKDEHWHALIRFEGHPTFRQFKRLDNLVFRKIPVSKVVGRPGNVLAEVETKARSPLKKKEPAGPGPPCVETTECDEESNVENKVISETEQFVDEGNNGKNVNSNVEPTSNTSSAANTPPVLYGPVTEYSKRMYKKLYGVNPPQTVSGEESKVEIGSNADIKENVLLKSSRENNNSEQRTEDNKTNKQEIKSPKIAAKLQEQVKEFIKLGTNSNSKTTVNKSPPVKSNVKSPSSSKIDATKQSGALNNKSSQPLVIYCDGSDRKSDLNESVSNILKSKRDGLHSNQCVEVMSKSTEQRSNEENNSYMKEKCTTNVGNAENLNPVQTNKETGSLKFSEEDKLQNNSQNDRENLHDCEKSKPNRLLTNMIKRISSKPVISPVTFGKLISSKVSQPPKNVNTTNETTTTPSSSTEKLHKDKHDAVHSSEKNRSDKKRNPHEETVKKKSFMTSLFGESPLKSSNSVVPLEVSNEKTHDKDNSSKSILKSQTLHTDSLVLPSSPSLDSDDPDDLIIDTTVCSQNTSACGSGSSKKDEGAEEISVNENNKSSIKCGSMEQSEVQHNSVETHIKGIDSKISVLNCSIEAKSVSDESSLLLKCIGPNKSLAENKSNEMRIASTVNDPENISKTNSSCLPDLSECFSLQSKSQLEVDVKCTTAEILESKETSLFKSAAGSQNVNVPNENNSELCSFLSHSSSSEMSNGNNSYKTSGTSVDNKKRFVPSPSQLSLVSALKHSDNSVFNITEDTAEFVSALTRVRDISPLRTPGKKKNESRPSEVDNANKEICNNSVMICAEKFNLLPCKSFDAAVEKNNLDAKDFAGPLLKSAADTQTHSLKNKNFSEYLKSSQPASNNEKSNKNLENSTEIQNTTSNDPGSVFRRSRPVRRIVLPNQNKETCSIKCNKENINNKSNKANCSLNSTTERVPSNKIEEDKSIPNSRQNNILNNSPDKNVRTVQLAVSETERTAQTIALENLSNDQKFTNLNTANESKKKDNILRDSPVSKKVIMTSINCEKKTFKRSESLKTMPKPVPKVTYDILNNKPEYKKLDERNVSFPGNPKKVAINNCINVGDKLDKTPLVTPKASDGQHNRNIKEQNNSKLIVSKTLYCNKSSSGLQNDSNVKPILFVEHLRASKKIKEESVAYKELEQSPHIANINKKTRISSFQRINPVQEAKKPKTINKTFKKPSSKEKVTNISTKMECSIQSQQSTAAVSPEAGTANTTVTLKSVKRSSRNTKSKKTNNVLKKSNNTSEAAINNVCTSTKKIKLTEQTNQNLSPQKKSSTKPLKNKSKSPSQNKKQLETDSQETDENNQLQTIESKTIMKKKKNGIKESEENLQSQHLHSRNPSTDNELFQKSKNVSPKPEIKRAVDLRRSLSSCSDKNINNSRISHSSSSSDVQCRNKSSKNILRSQSRSPQPGIRSKSCHQSRRIRNASPEIRKRSHSNYSRKLTRASPDFRYRDSHHRNRSSSRSPDLRRRRSYHMLRRSRSRSRETGFYGRSQHFARSGHRDSYEKYVHKYYKRRSRSKSPFWCDSRERRRGRREYRSPDFNRKKRSRSSSLERIDQDEKLKRRKQSYRHCSDQHCESPDRSILHDQKGLLKEEEIAPNQDSTSKSKRCKRSSSIHLNQDKETVSFLDEIKEIKNFQRIHSKKEVPTPEGGKIVSVEVRKSSTVCSINQMSVSNSASVFNESNLKNAPKINIPGASGFKQQLEGQTTEVVLKNNLDVSTIIIPAQQKPIPVTKYIRRRSRNLGDSDVQVVSFSTKLSKTSCDPSKPNSSQPEQAL